MNILVIDGKQPKFGAVAVALITGRVVFLMLLALTGRLNVPVFEYAQMTWMPGLVAVILQIALLPILAALYVRVVKD